MKSVIKNKILLNTISVLILLSFPLISLAAVSNLQTLLYKIVSVVNVIIPYLIAIGLIVFLIGILRYSFSDDEKTLTEARGLMIYGVIALFVMVSVWGLVNLLVNFIGPYSSAGQNVGSPKRIPYNQLKP